MKRPLIHLENHEAVYDFYQNHKPNVLTHRLGLLAFALAFRPNVHFADSSREAIADLQQGKTRFIYAPNHISDNEQFVVASMIQRERVLRSMRDNTFALGKVSLFKNKLLRLGIDTMGGVPTFRQSDARDKTGTVPEGLKTAYEAAKERLINMSITRMSRGDNMLIFPEGTRNRVDPSRILDLKRGIGEIACGVTNEANVALLPVGIYYGSDEEARPLRPTVYVGQPIEGPFDSVDGVLIPLHGGMQESLDAATELHRAA